jgi:hypothetical protein
MERKLTTAVFVFILALVTLLGARDTSNGTVYADVRTGAIVKSDSLMVFLLFIGLVLFVTGGWLLISSLIHNKKD